MREVIAVADGIVILVVFLVVLSPLVLYVLIREETSNPTVVDRDEAEREAMALGGLRSRSRDHESRAGRRTDGDASVEDGDASTEEGDASSADRDAAAADRESDRDRNWWDER